LIGRAETRIFDPYPKRRVKRRIDEQSEVEPERQAGQKSVFDAYYIVFVVFFDARAFHRFSVTNNPSSSRVEQISRMIAYFIHGRRQTSAEWVLCRPARLPGPKRKKGRHTRRLDRRRRPNDQMLRAEDPGDTRGLQITPNCLRELYALRRASCDRRLGEILLPHVSCASISSCVFHLTSK
jgi:hypothetical protein